MGKNDKIQLAPTVIEAIQKSGGITKYANLTEIEITRILPGEEGEYKKATINILDAILKGKHEQNLLLFDKDTILSLIHI